VRSAPLGTPRTASRIRGSGCVFLGRSHNIMNNVLRPVNFVLDRTMFIFKVTVFINRAKYEWNPVFYSLLRTFMQDGEPAQTFRNQTYNTSQPACDHRETPTDGNMLEHTKQIQMHSKRLEDNWHNGLLSSTKQRLPGFDSRLPQVVNSAAFG